MIFAGLNLTMKPAPIVRAGRLPIAVYRADKDRSDGRALPGEWAKARSRCPTRAASSDIANSLKAAVRSPCRSRGHAMSDVGSRRARPHVTVETRRGRDIDPDGGEALMRRDANIPQRWAGQPWVNAPFSCPEPFPNLCRSYRRPPAFAANP